MTTFESTKLQAPSTRPGGGQAGPRASYSRTTTGVVGISVVRTAKQNKTRLRTYFSVHMRPNGHRKNRKFCINTLGRQEAWRRALRCRATYEVRAGLAATRRAA